MKMGFKICFSALLWLHCLVAPSKKDLNNQRLRDSETQRLKESETQRLRDINGPLLVLFSK